MTKHNRLQQCIIDGSLGVALACALIFGSLQWFGGGTYEDSTTKVYAATDCANATIPEEQCKALVDIYDQMGGTSRNSVYTQGTGNTSLGGPSSGWLMNDDPCSWHGVTCDTSSPKNVIGLNFGGMKHNSCNTWSSIAGITGSFPSSFSSLDKLKTFNITHNTGISQSSLQGLTMPSSLQYYCANNAGLTSLSPTQFSGISNLIYLFLGNNQLTGLSSTQFSGLSNLYSLDLSYNQLQLLNPTQFSGLLDLQRLYLNDNQLQSLSPTQFQGLANLQSLYLYNNQLTGLSSTQFQGLSNLRVLHLDGNQLTSLSPTQFVGLTSLRNIYLNENQLQSLNPTQFQGLSNLQLLHLYRNQITGLSPTQFQGLSSLRNLYLNNNTGFTGAIPALYSGMNFTTNPGNGILIIRANGGNPNTICGQQPTWITNAWNQYFSGNRGNTDLDDLSRFGGTGQTVNQCPIGASCNTTDDCASGTCSENGNPSGIFTCQGTGTNLSPTVSLTSPNNGATFTGPANITLNAAASDYDGWVTSVVFYRNGLFLGTGTVSTGSTYFFSRTNVPAGTYSITAVATDNSGASTTSSIISVIVQAGGNNNTSCSAGTYGNGTTCTTCPANNYCPAGATTPTACPNGTTAPAGSDSSADCILSGQPDADNDGIPDSTEGTGDTDMDGTPNNQDTDSDNDGLTDTREQTTPNNGDANLDGIADRIQRTVRTMNTPIQNVQTTIDVMLPGGTGITCTGILTTQNQTEAQVANDSAYTYPFGLNRIIIPCASATIRIYYHGATNLSSYTYRKYLANTYQNFPVSFGSTNATQYIQFTLSDGGVGDNDGAVNGTITDPGGLAQMQTTPPSNGGGGGGGGRPSTVNCGNRRIDSGESCDDGNTRSGDGCSSTCTKESSTTPGETSSGGSSTTPSTPKAAMIAMLQETVQTLQDACAYDTTDRSKKVQKLRDIKREDRFDPESVLVNYCITKGYKEKRQKTAHAGIGEVIKMVTKIAAIDQGIEFNERDKPKKGLPYTDIKQNAWYATYVNAAYERDLLDGFTDTHKNKKELKAFTPISNAQVTLLIENAGGSISTALQEDDQISDLISLVLPAKPNLSPVKKQFISRAQIAELLIASFPDIFENHQYLVGNNGQYLIKLLQTVAQKTESEQRSYVNNKIQELKNVSVSEYAKKYKIDVDVIIGFLQKAMEY